MKTYLNFVTILIVILSLNSCSTDDQIPSNLGYSYFPVNVGHWVEYDVDSIIKDEFTGRSDTFQFMIREEIDSIFIDNSGNPTQRIERYKRTNTTQPWIIHKVWTSNINNTTAQKVEDNIRFIKLVFPVTLYSEWDGNAYNIKSESEYEYTAVAEPINLNGLNFDSSLTVIQAIDTNGLITDIIEFEQYATRVGMIYKEQVNIERDFNFDTIVSAFVYKEKIRSYGN